jgi:hypothetical protein
MQSLRTPVWRRSPDEPAPPIPTHIDSPASLVCLQFNLGTVNVPATDVTALLDGTM